MKLIHFLTVLSSELLAWFDDDVLKVYVGIFEAAGKSDLNTGVSVFKFDHFHARKIQSILCLPLIFSFPVWMEKGFSLLNKR